jgi:tRNA threonylcarbamoyladenosine biosynthesis protein TsaB
VIVLGFDTATSSTAVALRLGNGSTLQARDDPDRTPPTQPPGHTTRLLGMADELLGRANIGWRALERIAVGLGPGTFTGLRVGVATARGLAQSLEIELAGVSSLRALAEPALRSERDGSRVLAVLDARRGEAFLAAYEMADGGSVEELMPPRALAPGDLGSTLAQAKTQHGRENAAAWRAIGDGAVRFRAHLQAAGVTVPPDSSPLHLLSAEAICDLGARAEALTSYQAIVPDYRRRPDAEIALERK